MWRLWILAMGAPPGVLALRAAGPAAPPGATAAAAAGAAAGVALLVVCLLLARRHDDDPARGGHLARGATSALVAVPALGAVWIGAGPHPAAWLAVVLGVVAVALARARRRRGEAGGVAGLLRASALALGGGAAGALVLALAAAPLRAPASGLGPWLRDAALDVDAGVALRPLPACGAGVASLRVLAGRGAHPRLAPDGATLWLDAPGPDGRRQVYRLARETGRLDCVTCGEPGANRRPDPHPATGAAVVFDTDRWATAATPLDTELHVVAAGDRGRVRVSRRLTYHPGPDDHALYDPSGAGFVWMRGVAGGGFAAVRAGIRSGHGGLLLSEPRVLAAGGARAVAPLAWSPDARSLVLGAGHGGAPWAAWRLDPADATATPLGELVAADFSADGSLVALAAARRAGPGGVVRAAGALAERIRRVADGGAPAGSGTRVEVGPVDGRRVALELGDAAAWGVPTGVAMADDGRALALGQRRVGPDGPEERILWIERACAGAAGLRP